jgi:hypothetical protein
LKFIWFRRCFGKSSANLQYVKVGFINEFKNSAILELIINIISAIIFIILGFYLPVPVFMKMGISVILWIIVRLVIINKTNIGKIQSFENIKQRCFESYKWINSKFDGIIAIYDEKYNDILSNIKKLSQCVTCKNFIPLEALYDVNAQECKVCWNAHAKKVGHVESHWKTS